MPSSLCTMALKLGLPCLAHTLPGPVPLESPYIACKHERTVEALPGPAFQRRFDDAMGSGECRMFPAGYSIRAASIEGTLRSFTDPGTGRRYYTYTPQP